MEESSKLCLNCRRYIVASNYVMHTLHCERKLQLCELCKEPVPRFQFDDHLNENHSLEDCSFCRVPVEKWKLEHHQEEECPQMPVSCKYCNKKYTRKEIGEHTLACGSRTQECESCGQFVLIQDKDNHSLNCRKDKKVKTLKFCKYCELEFPFEEYLEHELSCGSRTEKCDLCGEFVMLKDKPSHSRNCEKVESQQDMFFCLHCKSGLNWRDYHDHVLNCKSRPIKCAFCEKTIKFEDIAIHDKICQQGLSEKDGMENNEQKIILCKYCGSGKSVDYYELHEMKCGSRVVKCNKCNEHYTIRNFNQHQEDCQKESEYDQSAMSCSYCYVEFPPDCLHEHEETCKDCFEECSSCNRQVQLKDKLKHREICSLGAEVSFHHCIHCQVKFRYDSIRQHEKVCGDRIETCQKCGFSVMIRDKLKHIESCVKKLEKIPCAICEDLIPSDELEKHTNDCIENNARYLQFQPKKECLIEPESAAYTESYQSYKQENEYKKNQDTMLCPYCNDRIPKKRFHNHKQFCQKAFKICPFCEFTFHIEEETEHSIKCDELKNIENSDDKRTAYAEQNEYNLRKYEQNSKTCYYCLCEIYLPNYPSHMKQCSKNLRKCSLCYETYHKDKEDAHMKKCVACPGQKQDQYIHEAFQDKKEMGQFNKESRIIDPRKCPKCNIDVPSLCFYNHFKDCKPFLQPCMYCGKLIHVNDLEHKTNCVAKKNNGAKPKKSNSKKQEKEKSGLFSRMYDGFKEYLSGSPYASNDSYSSSNYQYSSSNYPYPSYDFRKNHHGRDTLVPYPEPTAPVEETLIPCEFCNKLVSIEDLTVHETGCNPDITSHSTAITGQSNKTASNPNVREPQQEHINFSEDTHKTASIPNNLDMRFGSEEKSFGPEVSVIMQKSNRNEDEIKNKNVDSFTFMRDLKPKNNTVNVKLNEKQNEINAMEEKEIQSACQVRTFEKYPKKRDLIDEKVLDNVKYKTTVDDNFLGNQTVNEGRLIDIYDEEKIQKSQRYKNFENKKTILDEVDYNKTHERKSEETHYQQVNQSLMKCKNPKSNQTVVYSMDNPISHQKSKSLGKCHENTEIDKGLWSDDDDDVSAAQIKKRLEQNSYELRSKQIYKREDGLLKAKKSKNLETSSYSATQSEKHTKPGEFLNSDYYQQINYSPEAAYSSTKNFSQNVATEKALKETISENEKLCHTWQALDADKDISDRKLNDEFARNRKETSQNSYAVGFNYEKGDIRNDQSNFRLIDFEEKTNSLKTVDKNKFDFDHGQNMSSSFSGKQNLINSEGGMRVVTTIESDNSFIVSSKMKGAIKIDRLISAKMNPEIEKHQERPNFNVQVEEGYSSEQNLNIDDNSKAAFHTDFHYKNIEENFQDKLSIYKKIKDSFEDKNYVNFQCSEQAMEVDDENPIPNQEPMSRENFYTKLNNLSSVCNVSTEPPKSEEKDYQTIAVKEKGYGFNVFSNRSENDMQQFYEELLEVDLKEKSQTVPCDVCDNEMCICKINKSLRTTRSFSFSDEQEIKDFPSHQKERSKTQNQNEIDWKLEKKEKERLEQMEHENWKKYRENFDKN